MKLLNAIAHQAYGAMIRRLNKGKFYLKSATIHIANGRIKQRAVKGYRYCRVTAWEYLEADDEKFFSQFKQEQGVTYTW